MKNVIKDFIIGELLNNDKTLTLEFKDDLLTNGLIDSMGIIKLIQFIEQSFGYKIPPQDLLIENFESIDAIAVYLHTLHPPKVKE